MGEHSYDLLPAILLHINEVSWGNVEVGSVELQHLFKLSGTQPKVTKLFVKDELEFKRP